MSDRSTRSRTALVVLAALALFLTPAARASSEARYFEFERLNGVYSNPDPELAPVRQGALTVELRSPANQVRLHSHRLRLVALEDGTQGAVLQAEIEGRGDLEAELSVGGPATRLVDEVEIPRQSISVFGQIELQRVEGGYRVTAIELQPTVKVAIRSRLAGSLAETCRTFSRMLPLGVDCDGVESSLAQATLPLPGPGASFLLPDEGLDDDDRRRLDAHLAASTRP